MKTSPVRINLSDIEEYSNNQFIPITIRANSLSDVEYNFIENTIKSQNLKNYMNLKLMGLKHDVDNILAKNLCNI